ncbi:hypothetical protein MKW94_006403 [Papaver nudicaule]|uniref:Thionin-like protein n=1 Tax=Papaver nudicaule TaxID=74823 RepID=A0AA41VFI4_PAPNU|nr:hypothetical protein [Papaver nudicaule]
MEGKTMKMAFVMVMLVLAMSAKMSSADWLPPQVSKSCYGDCLDRCESELPAGSQCPAECLKFCSGKGNSAHDYCKLGCAATNCVGSSPGDIDECMHTVCAQKCNN